MRERCRIHDDCQRIVMADTGTFPDDANTDRCERCWQTSCTRQALEAAALKRIAAAETVAQIRECISDYYEDNVTGGSLHIVLDDYNYEDSSVQHCIEHAKSTFIPGSGARPDWHKETDPVGEALGRKLLALSIEDRAAANDWEFCRCGHAMSLHSWWDDPINPSSGASRAGTCGSATCPCVDASRAFTIHDNQEQPS